MRISALSFPLTPAIRQHVERRLENALSSTGISSAQASVRLLDINGSRGGVDKQCRVSVAVKSAAPIVAVVTSNDLYQAVDKAAATVGALIRRHFARRRSTRHQGPAGGRPQPVA